MKKIFIATFLCCFTCSLFAQVYINEFMAQNKSTLVDEDGDYSDWLELYNAGTQDVALDNWSITDKVNKPRKWVLPNMNLPAKSYLLVFLSDKNRRNPSKPLHGNFKLSGDGEYLGLYDNNGQVVHEYAPTYPMQQNDVSYGLLNGQATYLYQPTPGEENQLGEAVIAPELSEKGGYKDASFLLSIKSQDPSAKIWYTLDGSRPSEENAHLYTEPIRITKTTAVSAVCQSNENNTLYSKVVTSTYLFIQDIVRQSDTQNNYPAEWSYLTDSTFYAADYGMDQSIYNDLDYHQDLIDAFASIPTVCIVTNPEHLFSHSTHPDSGGIYIHTEKSHGGYGVDWERPISLEFYHHEDADRYFQINCGLRLHGGNSRNPANSPKHSFRVSFRDKYGASKLNFKIFEEKSATDRFDHLVLRAGYNFTWIKNGSPTLYPQNIIQRTHAQYIYDSFAKDAQLAMGQVATHSRFAHLFINGLYWGLYDISEKTNDDFAQAYMGGKDDDYDVIGDHNEIIDGNDEAYKTMYNTACKVGSDARDKNYLSLIQDQLLDLDNFIDYMLINYYIGNRDWDNNNWRCARSRVAPGEGFKYFVWDAEDAFTDVDINRVKEVKGNPTKMMSYLKKHPEFRMLLADRVQKHFFDDGALSETGAAALYQNLADEIYDAIVSESARWGDYRKSTGESDVTYTRNDFWLPRLEDLKTNYFPYRTQIVLKQLKDADMYKVDVQAPSFSKASGSYENSVSVGLEGEGDIYYSLNGDDPRIAYSGNIASNAKLYKDSLTFTKNCHIKARSYHNGKWSALVEREFSIYQTPEVDALNPQQAVAFQAFFQDGCLQYYLPKMTLVDVEIFDMQGRVLARITHLVQTAGWHQTPELELESGSYIYRLRANGQYQQGKFIY